MEAKWPYRSGKYLTKYERAAVIGERMRQLAKNSPPMVPIEPNDTTRTLALRELDQKVMPIYIPRTLPDGTVERISVNHLISNERD
jgi:DNA-directed RNA polymerase I, II, and III subunit RPABC2